MDLNSFEGHLSAHNATKSLEQISKSVFLKSSKDFSSCIADNYLCEEV